MCANDVYSPLGDARTVETARDYDVDQIIVLRRRAVVRRIYIDHSVG